MASSHDRMRIQAATKAYKAGEYKKALFHLQKVHDQSRVEGRIKQVRVKLKAQQAPVQREKSKVKPEKRTNWLRRIVVIGLTSVLIIGAGIAGVIIHYNNTFDSGEFWLEIYCERIRSEAYCEQWVENVEANESADSRVKVCTDLYSVYRETAELSTCLNSDSINPLSASGFTSPVNSSQINDNVRSALATAKLYCENWQSEGYCTAWSWYQLSENFNAMMDCYFQYPSFEEIIGFQECIILFSTDIDLPVDYATPVPATIAYPTYPVYPTSAPALPARRPNNCADARAMGLNASQAGSWSHLDRDGDGVACYGD